MGFVSDHRNDALFWKKIKFSAIRPISQSRVHTSFQLVAAPMCGNKVSIVERVDGSICPSLADKVIHRFSMPAAGNDLKEQYLSKANNNPKSNESTVPAASRRTGIDRRWIVSHNHQPERRRGTDRRAERKRSYNDQLVLDEPEKDGRSNIGFGTESSKRIDGLTLPSPVDGWIPLTGGQTTK